MYDIVWILLKMACIRRKFSDTLRPMGEGGKCLNSILNYLFALTIVKSTNGIQICQSIFQIKKCYKKYKYFMYRLTQKFSLTLRPTGKCLKYILTYLHCTKCNEISLCHLYVKKSVSCEKWYKCYKYFEYRLIQKNSNILRSMDEKF